MEEERDGIKVGDLKEAEMKNKEEGRTDGGGGIENNCKEKNRENERRMKGGLKEQRNSSFHLWP